MIKILSSYNPKNNDAGPKAKHDVERIVANKYGAQVTTIARSETGGISRIGYVVKKLLAAKKNSRDDTVIVQVPYSTNMNYTGGIKNKIVFVHDIQGLRTGDDRMLSYELSEIDSATAVIAHNRRMKEYLVSKGIDGSNIYCLELFDYLTDSEPDENYNFDSNSVKVVYPGNLIEKKSPFLYQLDEAKMNFSLFLYGNGIRSNINSKLIYKGVFSPDDLSGIKGDIGLIWDGNYNDSDNDGLLKSYIRLNNPHKLSCCLAAGLPVIAWEQAAIADFIIKNRIGYLINSIYDINDIDFSAYDEVRSNAAEIGRKVRQGYYTVRVMDQVLKNIQLK